MFDQKYYISASDAGYHISTGFTSDSTWENEYTPSTLGKPEPNYYIYNKGNLQDFALTGSAKAYVSAGGSATNVEVNNGGKVYVSGGEVAEASLASNGILYVSGGTFKNITISNGGQLLDECQGKTSQFVNAANFTGNTVLYVKASICNRYTVADGSSAYISGSHALSAGFLKVSANAVANNLLIANFGSMTVGGSALATVVSSGGSMIVLKDGLADKTQVLSAGGVLVKNGGKITNVAVSSGGSITVKGTAENTKILANGKEIVEGTATSTVVSAGGSQRIDGGTAVRTKVQGSATVGKQKLEAGFMHVYSGTANKVEVYGSMLLGEVGNYKGKASALYTKVVSGVMEAVTNGAYTFSTTISKGGVQKLSGSIDSKATIYGSQVLFGGSAFNVTVKGGGKQIINTGLASATIVEANGILSSVNSGITQNTRIYGQAFLKNAASDKFAKIYGTQTVNSQAKAVSATIYEGGKQIVAGGSALGTTISSGGSQLISAWGHASGTVVKKGGILNVVQGSTDSVTNQGKVTVGKQGSVSKVTVKNGGLITVNSNGWIDAATIEAGGNVVLNAGGSAVSLNAKKGAIIAGGTNANKIIIAHNFTLGGNVNAKNFHLRTANIGMLKLAVSGVKNTLGSLKDNVGATYLQVSEVYRSRISFDLRSVATKTNMLTLSTKSNLRCYCTIQTAKNQKLGTYKLAQGLNMTFGQKSYPNGGITIKVGSKSFSTKAGTTVKKNGMQYQVTMAKNQCNLAIGLVYGKISKGSAKKDTFKGTANSDIFYGGKGNDSFSGTNGRDVAVYDKTAWGTDSIAKTGGTMTLLFKDLNKKDLKTQLKNGTMTITRATDAKQKISIAGWSNDTHNIVYATGMQAFNTYLKEASPTAKKIEAARTEVFKKAGLATA